MLKKWLALLLALVMVFSLGMHAFAEEAVKEEEEEIVVPPELIAEVGYAAAYAIAHGVDPNEIVYYDHITVGNPTIMRGDFFTDLWGNSTSDIDVRDLLHDYNLVYWAGGEGMFTTNPTVVTGITVTDNANTDDRTFTVALNRNLRYSDGSPITAWDYAFTYLLLMSSEIEGAGANRKQEYYILGSEDYALDRTEVLAGVRVTDDYTISVTLDGDFLPFFYEMGLLSCNPYPISVIAPGVTVRDDGDGVYLDDPNRVFTADLLNRTLNDPETGYCTYPSVVSGPYRITSFDGVTAEFERNPYFIGDEEGEMPLIERLTYTLSVNETMIDKLVNGEFDLLNKVLREDTITQGLQQIGYGEISMSNYPRTGLSYIAFTCEKPEVSSAAVRQAIAWCMDRDAVVEDYSGNFGIRVDGYYGIGQWMYGIVNGTIAPPVVPPENPLDAKAQAEYERELRAWEALSLENLVDYELDLDEANRLLAQDGWVKNSDGLREKWINGEKVVLDLTMLYPEGNRIKESFEKYLIPNLEEVGIRLTLKPATLLEIAETAYSGEDRDVEMFYHPSNFDLMFDAAPYFEIENGQPGHWSFTRQKDAELYRRALAMRETEPGDVLSYMQKWVLFQERVNEQLPILPIYGNVYFDFFTSKLHDYDITESVTWGEAILGATKADIPEIEIVEPAEEEPEENGEVVIEG